MFSLGRKRKHPPRKFVLRCSHSSGSTWVAGRQPLLAPQFYAAWCPVPGRVSSFLSMCRAIGASRLISAAHFKDIDIHDFCCLIRSFNAVCISLLKFVNLYY